ncbi:MAG: ATP-binding protein, partial [Ignavibacteriaceae bacterium]|nr:ATP-binding protein [Ignavibacteriaceae bacterium]
MPDSHLCDKKSLVAIMDSLEVGIIFVDGNNDIIFINKAAEKIRRMKNEDRLGTSILDCHGGKMKDRVLDVMNSFKVNSDYKRHKTIKTNGNYFDNAYNLVKDENEEFLGVVLLSQDVTEKKALEDELKHANEQLEEKVKQRTEEIEQAYEQLKVAQQQLMQSEKMSAIGQFVAGLAHQINNPLDGIQNCLHTISNDLTNIDQTKNYIDLSIEGLYKIEILVRKLLSYARPHEFEKNVLNVNTILEDILSLTLLKLKDRNISLVKDFCPELPQIFGDGHHLEQMFVNLIINAFDAMGKGGELSVKTYADEDGMINIKIADTGKGIPKENLQKIFEPFYTTKQKNNGTGLGLYLSYNAVTQHGGKILVKSEVGKGTEFIVSLPAFRNESE